MSTTARTPSRSDATPAGGAPGSRSAGWRSVADWARSPRGGRWLLAGIVLAGAVLRFATLGEQSFSADEAFTVALSRMSFGRMLHELPITEATPPLHYVLVWLWARVFGTHEVGMRSLSALIGTLTIPAVYGVAARVADRRAALIAAGLASVSPILVYYSQEARSYALLVLLSTLALYCFLRALDEPTTKWLGAWSVGAALALLTHYFAVFMIAPEAAWLIYRLRPRRAAVLASVLPAITEIAVAPLAYAQRHPSSGGWATKYAQVDSPLLTRIVKIPRELLLGFEVPLGKPLFVLLVVLCLLGGWWALRSTDARTANGTRVLLALSAVAFGVPIVAGAVPALDLVFTRNFIAGIVPVLVVVAIGLSRRRAGLAAAAVFAAVSLAMVIAVDLIPADQRPDIRGAAHALGPVRDSRIVVVTGETIEAASIYLPHAHTLSGTVKYGEIDVIAMPPSGAKRAPSLRGVRAPVPGFTLVERRVTAEYTILRFQAPRPTRVNIRKLIPGYSWKGWTAAEYGSPPVIGLLLQYATARVGGPR